MEVKIVTDSTADIPLELVGELDIRIVPLYVNFQGKTYRDNVDISREELYSRMISSPILPTTSQPSPADFTRLYLELSCESREIVSIHLGSKLSGTYAAALAAGEMVKDKCHVEVVDSSLVSGALGLVVISAGRLARAGGSLEMVLANIKDVISRVRAYGLLESFKYVLHGGRLNVVGSLLGNVLNVKPFLKMRDGMVHLGGILRTRSQGLDKIFNLIKDTPALEDVIISHSTTPDEILKLKERFGSLVGNGRLYVSRLAPVLGVHGGPGTLVVAAQGGALLK